MAIGLLARTAFAADAAKSPARGPADRVELKVVKAYAAKDGDAAFRAFVLDWNGQEVVVVDDVLASPDYKVGDMVPVAVTKTERESKAAGERTVLRFRLVAPAPPRKAK